MLQCWTGAEAGCRIDSDVAIAKPVNGVQHGRIGFQIVDAEFHTEQRRIPDDVLGKGSPIE